MHHSLAGRHDADLGDEQLGGLDEGSANGQPLPQATVIVGVDGGYVRNWHDKKHNFEVVVGESMAADRCRDSRRTNDYPNDAGPDTSAAGTTAIKHE